jgi:hypothetical protein
MRLGKEEGCWRPNRRINHTEKMLMIRSSQMLVLLSLSEVCTTESFHSARSPPPHATLVTSSAVRSHQGLTSLGCPDRALPGVPVPGFSDRSGTRAVPGLPHQDGRRDSSQGGGLDGQGGGERGQGPGPVRLLLGLQVRERKHNRVKSLPLPSGSPEAPFAGQL